MAFQTKAAIMIVLSLLQTRSQYMYGRYRSAHCHRPRDIQLFQYGAVNSYHANGSGTMKIVPLWSD